MLRRRGSAWLSTLPFLLKRVPSRPPRRALSGPSIHNVPTQQQLSFALITPRSLAKSLTGGIIARILATPDVQLVGARMLHPSKQLTDELKEEMQRAASEDGIIDPYEQALIDHFHWIFGEEKLRRAGIDNNVMLLMFAGGPKTRALLEEVVGNNVPHPDDFGRTIRGTYGDYFLDENGKVLIFQPAAIVPQSDQSNRKCLEILSKYLDSDHNLIQPEFRLTQSPQNDKKPIAKETGLVMIKPDNFERPSSLPGHIIDMFGTTGLQLIGARVFSMSVERGIEFYGFLEEVFKKKLRPNLEENLRKNLSNTFEFKLEDQDITKMSDMLISKTAHHEVCKIIQYMTGLHPDQVPKEQRNKPGPAKCFALLFHGQNAIEVIRSKLGVTDPKKARAGTIRSDYGHDLMRNGAHASDSPAAALRERKIVGLLGDEPSEEKNVIQEWLGSSHL